MLFYLFGKAAFFLFYQMRQKTFILLLFIYFANSPVRAQSREIMIDMINHCNSLQGYKARVEKIERIKGELIKQVSDVKLARHPLRIYIHQLYPKKGVEILCKAGSDKAIVNMNSFPWINLHLDPYGTLMRRNQHHVIYDSGFDLLASILRKELAKIGNDTLGRIFYHGIVRYDGRPSYHIEMRTPDYRLVAYTVQENEDLTTIARKLNISEYKILELNDDVDFYDDVKSGQVITVTSDYALKMNIYIDQEYMLPLYVEVFDEEGLYESYGYTNFILNPPFAADEFNEDYEEYNF